MTLQFLAETIKHELLHPVLKDEAGNPQPTGLVLEVLPADHDDVVIAVTNLFKELGKTAENADTTINSRVKFLGTVIAGWEVKAEHLDTWTAVFKKLGHEDATFTKEKLHALLEMKTARWIRNEIDSIFADAERFFQKGSNS